MERFFPLVIIVIALGLIVASFGLWQTSNELDALKNIPPKTITEYVTKKAPPCPSEVLDSIVVTPYGPLVIHIRPGDIDRAIELKHEAIKDIERQRMEKQGPKPIPKAPISDNGSRKRMVEG